MGYGRRRHRKSVLESVFSLVLLAILAGAAGGGIIGMATNHKASSSVPSTGLSGQ
jgi:hypothetical protein